MNELASYLQYIPRAYAIICNLSTDLESTFLDYGTSSSKTPFKTLPLVVPCNLLHVSDQIIARPIRAVLPLSATSCPLEPAYP